ncbi:MAG: hypothetical protein WC915_06605 [archaeon]|jgi:hypothetical protein
MKTIEKMVFYESLFPFVKLVNLAKEKVKIMGWKKTINDEIDSLVQCIKIGHYEKKLINTYKLQACPYNSDSNSMFLKEIYDYSHKLEKLALKHNLVQTPDEFQEIFLGFQETQMNKWKKYYADYHQDILDLVSLVGL